jgi:hypothetical protein
VGLQDPDVTMPRPPRSTRGYVRLVGVVTEATVCLLLVKVTLRVVPFRRLAGRLGGQRQASPTQIDDATRDRARQVGRALRVARRRLPFQSRCLVMALAALLMLRRRRLDSTLYFGVTNRDGDKLQAHAWLRVGDVMVTGGAGRHGHVVVGQFASRPPEHGGDEQAESP